jgi:hypothetical protein|tara:strand:+ start:269 stop:751 length:483 start_codon:yes stop_codon:yes gene_type:complete
MKKNIIINIFYLLSIVNYLLHKKINCLITLIVSYIILYYVLKDDKQAKLISLIFVMFFFCFNIVENIDNKCSDEMNDKCKYDNKVCIKNICYERVCTKQKEKECQAVGGVCDEYTFRNCIFKKNIMNHYDRGFIYSSNEPKNKFRKRVDERDTMGKYYYV